MHGLFGKGIVKTILLILVVIELAIILSLARKYVKHAGFARQSSLDSDITGKYTSTNSLLRTNRDNFTIFKPNKTGLVISTGSSSPLLLSPRTWNYSSAAFSDDTSIPRIVHQILSGNTLTFRHYLSILSVYKILKPYRIVLYVHYSFKPQQYEYNRWYQKATAEIPCLEIVHLLESDGLGKQLNVSNELRFMSLVLNRIGGIYVSLNTLLNFDPWTTINDHFHLGITENSSLGFFAVAKCFNFKDFVRKIISVEDLPKQNTSACVSSQSFTGTEHCCYINHELFPVDIMQQNSSFASFARFLFYRKSQILKPQMSFPPIPKIIHYVWFGHRNVSFSMFVSFRSTIRFVRPTKVMMYVDRYNLGPYFDEMRNYNIVRVVYYGAPNSVFQRRITNPKHASDYVRTEVLFRFGGIYMDWDVFWLKPVDDLVEMGYETIAAFEHYNDMTPRQEFPDTINMGVVLARPGSRFILLWQDSFHEYTGEHATFHAIEMVYKIYEEHPDLLYIEKKLQVMCFRLKCHPLWLDNYKDSSLHNDFNYTNTAYAVHFTDPVPIGFMSEEDLKNSKGFFADMARHIFGIV